MKKNIRQQAETLLNKNYPVEDLTSDKEIQAIIHELQVHQVELEMQNDELRRIYKQLEQSQRKYFNLYNLAPVGYITFDINGIVQDINLAALKLLGSQESRLINHTLVNYMSSSMYQTLAEHRLSLINTHEPQICELKIDRPDGQQLLVELHSILLEAEVEDEQPAILSTMIDITVRKQIEWEREQDLDELESLTTKLTQANEQLAREVNERKRAEVEVQHTTYHLTTLIELIGEGITLSDEQGYFEIFNQKMTQLTGYTHTEVNQTPDLLGQLYPNQADYQDALAGLLAMKQPGDYRELETTIQTRDGQHKVLLVSTAKIWYQNRGWFLSVYRDITGRKQVEEERTRLINQLQTAAEVSSQLTAILDVDELLGKLVVLLHNRFKLYHVHVYLLNEAGDDLIMWVGSGTVGQQLRQQGHHIPFYREQSLVALAARTQEIVLVGDVANDPYFMSNVLLPETRSEVAIPLMVSHNLIGVLDLQDKRSDRFLELDLNVFNILAGQIAVAVQNAQLFAEQKCTEFELRIQQETLRQLSRVVQQTADQVLITNRAGIIEYVNPAFEKLTGYTAVEAIGQTPSIVWSDQHDQQTYDRLWETILSNQIYRGITINCKKSGTLYYEEKTITPIKNELGQITHFVWTGRDITERKEAENALRESEAKFRNFVAQSRDGITLINEQGQVIEWNKAMEQITGYSASEVRQKFIWEIKLAMTINQYPTVASHLKPTIKHALKTGEATWINQLLEAEYHHVDGQQKFVQNIIFPIKTTKGFMLGTILRDVTTYKQAEVALQRANEELRRLAALDGLTMIANRRHFDDYLEHMWQQAAHVQDPLSLILVDIDYFKRYNDTYGHQAGDDCLKQVAQTIKKAVKRTDDLVARYGGEEFAVILPHTKLVGAFMVAQTIQERLTRLQLPHAGSEVSDYITLSIGIATLIPSATTLPEKLIALADEALYKAKAGGRNRIEVKPFDGGDKSLFGGLE